MPELPEVEVLRRSLAGPLLGRRVEAVRVHHTGLREPVDRRSLEKAAVGRRIVALGRRSKYLLIDLDGAHSLIVHLGMSGRLTLVPESEERELHEHVSFALDDGRRLRFRDPRRFGMVLARPTETLFDESRFRALGPEPLDGNLDGKALAAAAERRRGPVKGFLLNGSVVAGVGNIYACEALWRAGVHPKRTVDRIAAARWDRLAAAVRETLSDAVEQGGTTLNDFADGEGNSGYFQVSLAVYGREGEPCPRCERPIRRIVQGQRSTFYCVGCQR